VIRNHIPDCRSFWQNHHFVNVHRTNRAASDESNKTSGISPVTAMIIKIEFFVEKSIAITSPLNLLSPGLPQRFDWIRDQYQDKHTLFDKMQKEWSLLSSQCPNNKQAVESPLTDLHCINQ
jgi:hypothetical protein